MMGLTAHKLTLGTFSGNATGSTVQIGGNLLPTSTLYVYGTFTATLTLEASPDGQNWVPARDTGGTDISTTAPAAIAVGTEAVAVRAKCSGYASGSATVLLLIKS